MMEPQSLTFTGRLRSVNCAINGIQIMLKTQHNAWLHAVATVAVIALGLAVRLSAAEWCWIVLAIVSVWTAEALNTAFEFLTDVASPSFHPIAGKAKDVAAAAVLLAACGAAAIGLLVFGPHVPNTVEGRSLAVGSQDIAHCDAPSGSLRRCLLRDGNWEHRVYIENGIRTDVALQLLVAIRDGRVINNVQGPELPAFNVSRVWQIRKAQRSGGQAIPHEFEIRTLERPAQPEGFSFLVNLRQEFVEVVACASWTA